MTVILGLLYVIEVTVALLLVLVVMLQKPKEGGLGGAIGGGMLESTLGADAGNVLIKATSILGGIFLANTLLLAVVLSHRNSNSLMAGEEPAPQAEQQALPELPQIPAEAPAAPSAPAAPAAPTP